MKRNVEIIHDIAGNNIVVVNDIRFKENLEGKHNMNAKFGWYRYDSRFAIPVYGEMGEMERYSQNRERFELEGDQL